MLEKLANISMPFHQACMHLAPQGRYQDAYQAIVCGAPLPESLFRGQLEHTGLYFLIASTATHLLFVESWLRWCLEKRRWAWAPVFGAAFLLTLVSSCSAPSLRACTGLILGRMVSWLKLGWSRTQVITAAGLTAAVFCPSRASMLGLILSWAASLAVGGLSGPPNSSRHWWQSLGGQVRIYAFLVPPLLPIAVPHPFSILAAFVCFPTVATFLFSLSLIAVAIPGTSRFIDWQWDAFQLLIAKLAALMPPGLQPLPVPVALLFIYLALLTACAWRTEGAR